MKVCRIRGQYVHIEIFYIVLSVQCPQPIASLKQKLRNIVTWISISILEYNTEYSVS